MYCTFSFYPLGLLRASLVAQLVKNPLAMWEDLALIRGSGRSSEEGKDLLISRSYFSSFYLLILHSEQFPHLYLLVLGLPTMAHRLGLVFIYLIFVVLCYSAWDSHYSGFSCCRAWGLDTRTQQLWLMDLVAPWHVESFQNRDRTCVPCIGRWIPIHCNTREFSTCFLK